jgi:hypothetical protein
MEHAVHFFRGIVMKYKVKNGVIYCKKGIPYPPRFIVDGRLAFRFEEAGITQVDYLSPAQFRGNGTVFLRRLWDGFRYYLEKDKLTYKPEYVNTRVWPFCVEAEWNIFGSVIKHRVMAVDESIVIQIQTPVSMAQDACFKLEFYSAFGLTPCDEEDVRFSDRGVDRQWNKWEYENTDNMFYGGFEETVKDRHEQEDEFDLNHYKPNKSGYLGCKLNIGIGADFAIDCFSTPNNSKHILRSPKLQAQKTYSFIISFQPEKMQLQDKIKSLIENMQTKVDKQYERYVRAADNSPRLVSPYKLLNHYLSLIPLYHESLKITDYPGAIKANSYAWVWGWDGITASYATAYWNDPIHLRDMLKFYRDTASEEYGIAHALSNDMHFILGCAVPAQGMYITLLQLYYSLTGDLAFVKEIYPFAKWIFEKTLELEIKGTGLCEGTSMYPDFPIFMKETGKDLSGLNNTIFYCTVRSMEYLAVLAGDHATAESAAKGIKNIEDHFLKLFFDKEKGFIVSSVDSVTLEKRNSYNSNAVKWENNYCCELMEPVFKANLDFFEKNVVCEAGLREIPVWSDVYDMDANQLHCWWPVTGEYFMRLVNEFDRKDLIEKWIGWIDYWSEMLMCPEGISCYIETSQPDLDRWNTLTGLWYGYNMRGWYQAAIHGVFGLDIEAGGITFFPYSGEEMSLKNLKYRSRVYDIDMKGSGPYIGSIEAEGALIKGTNKLPVDFMQGKKHIRVKVNRTKDNPYKVYIKYGYGIDIRKYSYEDGLIRAELCGIGTCRLKMAAAEKPEIKINNKAISAIYDEASGIVTLELVFKLGEIKYVEIR